MCPFTKPPNPPLLAYLLIDPPNIRAECKVKTSRLLRFLSDATIQDSSDLMMWLSKLPTRQNAVLRFNCMSWLLLLLAWLLSEIPPNLSRIPARSSRRASSQLWSSLSLGNSSQRFTPLRASHIGILRAMIQTSCRELYRDSIGSPSLCYRATRQYTGIVDHGSSALSGPEILPYKEMLDLAYGADV